MLTIMDISQTPEIVRYEGETLVALIKAQVEKTSSAYASYVSSVSDSVIFGATNPIRFLAMRITVSGKDLMCWTWTRLPTKSSATTAIQ